RSAASARWRASSSLAPWRSAARWISSRCAASSSTARSGSSGAPADRAWRATISGQSIAGRRSFTPGTSRRLDPRHHAQGGEEPAPVRALAGQDLPARLRDPVVVAAALARLLHPAAAQPTAVLQPVEGRVQGGEREAQRAAGAGLDLLGDLVAVQGPRL